MAFNPGGGEKFLPLEVVSHICSFLNSHDILRLSSVNSFWRNSTNTSVIWKRLCVHDFNVDPSQNAIIERACRVRPAFQIPTNDSSNLTSVCDWRIRFAQEIYVANNWRNKRYHVEDLPKENKIAKKIVKYFHFHCTQKAYYVFGDLILIDTQFKFFVSRITDTGIVPADPILFPPPLKKGQVFLFKSAFCVISRPFFSFYVLNGDHFELTARSIIHKPPEVPVLMEESSFVHYLAIDDYYSYQHEIQVNDRFLFASLKRTVKRKYRTYKDYPPVKSYFLSLWDLKDLKYYSCTVEFDIFEHFTAPFHLAKGSSPLLYVLTKRRVILVDFLKNPVTKEILFEFKSGDLLCTDSSATVDDALLAANYNPRGSPELKIVKRNGFENKQLSCFGSCDHLHLLNCRSAIRVFARRCIWELDKHGRFLNEDILLMLDSRDILQCQHVISDIFALTLEDDFTEYEDSNDDEEIHSDRVVRSKTSYEFLIFENFRSFKKIDFGPLNEILARSLSNSNKIVIVDKFETGWSKEVYFFY